MKRFYGDIAPICINFNHFTNWTKIEKAGTIAAIHKFFLESNLESNRLLRLEFELNIESRILAFVCRA